MMVYNTILLKSVYDNNYARLYSVLFLSVFIMINCLIFLFRKISEQEHYKISLQGRNFITNLVENVD